jgi:import receptor subunit TOM20
MHASSVLTLTGATLVTGFVGYALYFDYKRRNDPVFRSQLKKDRKKTLKELKKQGDRKKKEVGDVVERTVNELNKPGAIPLGVNEREEV